MKTAESVSLGRRILGFAKPLLGLAILAWVVSKLPFDDRLQWIPEEGDAVDIAGTIESEWKAAEIEFKVDREEPLPAALPAALSQHLTGALADQDVVRVSKSGVVGAAPLEDARLDWQPRMQRVFGGIETGGLLLGFLFLFLALANGTLRWWRLLAAAGCHTSFYNAFRLNFLGLFFNLVVPAGLTGGDLIKGVVVARENPGRRAAAMVSVFVDRVLGLIVLIALAAVVILLDPDYGELRVPVLIALAIGAGGGILYWNRPLRRAIGFDEKLEKLPFGDKLKTLDDAGALYAHHPGTVALALVLSLGNHIFTVIGVVFLGGALGAEVAFKDYLAVVPVANIISAIPISPGGWGVGEAAYAKLFELIGANPTLGVAISITFRLCLTLLGLAGGLFMLLPGPKVDVHDLDVEPEPESAAVA